MDLGSSYMTAKILIVRHHRYGPLILTYRDGVEMAYPVKTKKQKPVKQLYMATVSEQDGRLLFEKRPDTGLLAGFWTFPLEEIQSIDQIVGEQLRQTQVHVFTHRRWEIWLVKRSLPLTDTRQYLTPDEWQHLSLPTVQHKLLDALEE